MPEESRCRGLMTQASLNGGAEVCPIGLHTCSIAVLRTVLNIAGTTLIILKCILRSGPASFGEGTHLRLFDKLGAHLMEVEGIRGTRFTVWAPNAKRVSVVGEFNHWNGLQHPMQAIGSSGIWELFLPGIGEGMLYKFEIKGQNGEVFLKSDPFAFASEIRPSTASRVANLEDYVWQDESWMENRTRQDPLKQPINIYEVHLGS